MNREERIQYLTEQRQIVFQKLLEAQLTSKSKDGASVSFQIPNLRDALNLIDRELALLRGFNNVTNVALNHNHG